MPRSKKGFIIILVTVAISILILSIATVVSIGCSELLATRTRNDLLVSAYYVAISGAEKMYAYLKDIQNSGTIDWNALPSFNNEAILADNVTIGSYTTTVVRNTPPPNELYIVSVGTVKGHSATATVRYGYAYDDEANLTGPVPVGCGGTMTLTSDSNPAKLSVEGPVVSEDINQSPDYVTVERTLEASLPEVGFFDTPEASPLTILKAADGMGEGGAADGVITLLEAQAGGAEAEYNTVNAYTTSDDVTQKDAFYYYYTTYLNDAAHNPTQETLYIGSGQSHYYATSQTFDQGDIANDVPVIFVDGNVTISFNDQNWQGSDTLKHTVVATGTITIDQPTNRPGDSLTLIAYGDVDVTGTMGDKGGLLGDTIIFAYGNVNITGGGKLNASIFANGNCTIDTEGTTGKYHRDINNVTADWTDENNVPIGLPTGYPRDMDLSTKFKITGYPLWQRK